MAYIHKETFEMVEKLSQINEKCLKIDDGIVPVIQTLNRKGYFTQECCSGHPFKGTEHKSRHCYIVFEKGVSLPFLPPEFTIERSYITINGTKMIINKYNKSDEYNIGIKKLEKMLVEKPELQKEISNTIWRDWKSDVDFYLFLHENVKALEQLYKWALDLPDLND